METCELICHPDSPASSVTGVTARIIGLDRHWLTLRWRIDGAREVRVPPLAGKGRADGLWQATCFELFALQGEGYCEFNLSPSERWAAYDFTGYRQGMTERAMPRHPVCTWRSGSAFAIFDAAIPMSGMPALPARLGLSAVIEELDGTKSYWALAHPPGQPDFHHPTCFAATLEPPESP